MCYDLPHSRCVEKLVSVDILFIAICRVCFLPIAILSSLVAVHRVV